MLSPASPNRHPVWTALLPALGRVAAPLMTTTLTDLHLGLLWRVGKVRGQPALGAVCPMTFNFNSAWNGMGGTKTVIGWSSYWLGLETPSRRCELLISNLHTARKQ